MLALKTRAVSVAFETVSFFMVEDDRTIRVDASQALLAQIDGPPPKTKNGYVERLTRHKRLFAQIAAGLGVLKGRLVEAGRRVGYDVGVVGGVARAWPLYLCGNRRARRQG